MLETSARLLRLLSLLQTRPNWSGAELADRLGMSDRTIRRDIERLRDLGYPVHAARGVAGYRLGAGAALPPLLLDDDEAVAVAVGLRTAAAGIRGIEEASLGALAKLEQLLPSRLRRRVNAVQASTLPVPGDGAGPRVDPAVLAMLAGACRDRERLHMAYRDHHGSLGRRAVEPYRLVSWGRRWYLVAWDLDREGWRILRIDRVEPTTVTPTGQRFTPLALPEGGTWPPMSRAGYRPPPGATTPESGSMHPPRRSGGGSRRQPGWWRRSMRGPACCAPAPTPLRRWPSTWACWVPTSRSMSRPNWSRISATWPTATAEPPPEPVAAPTLARPGRA
jgi:biotin operon repressor BirA-like protein